MRVVEPCRHSKFACANQLQQKQRLLQKNPSLGRERSRATAAIQAPMRLPAAVARLAANQLPCHCRRCRRYCWVLPAPLAASAPVAAGWSVPRGRAGAPLAPPSRVGRLPPRSLGCTDGNGEGHVTVSSHAVTILVQQRSWQAAEQRDCAPLPAWHPSNMHCT